MPAVKKTASKKTAAKTGPRVVDAVKPLNIYQRINKVMSLVDYIQKDGTVTIKTAGGSQFTYTAVTHDAVTAALRGHMVDQGIVVQLNVINSADTVDDNGWVLTRLKVQARFINMDVPTDYIEYSASAYGTDRGDKGPGKALSYAMKYIYLKAFMLETGEDEESRVSHGDLHITPEQLIVLENLMDETGSEEETFVNYVNNAQGLEVGSLAELPRRLYPFAEAKLQAKKRQGKT